MIKTDEEIDFVRRAAAITDRCFSQLLPSIKPGVTEKEIVKKLEELFSGHTVKPAFPPIVAFGSHTSVVHYFGAPTSDMRCRKQEIVLLDFGVKVNGYYSDMTRMVFVGIPRKEWKKAYETILFVQTSCLGKIQSRHGKSFSGAHLDRFARSLIQKSGLPPYPHGLGHNVGKKIHELPRLSRKKDASITPGMVFTIEPGTYIKDSYGIRIEDTVVFRKDGIEILTKSPKTLLTLCQ